MWRHRLVKMDALGSGLDTFKDEKLADLRTTQDEENFNINVILWVFSIC